jgi:phospholipid transport system substrate-binding protein
MKTRVMLIVIAAALSVALQQSRCQAEPPVDTVRQMLDEAISIQTDPTLQGQEFRDRRRTAIKKVILKNFYFNDMAKQALTSHWDGLNNAKRSEFSSIFQDLFLDSYSRLVLDFLKKERVQYLGEDVQKGEALVKTTIYRINESIPVDYSLMLVDGKWLVRDVKIDGVSIVENYRKSFSRLIKQESFDALLKRMRMQQQAIQKSSYTDSPSSAYLRCPSTCSYSTYRQVRLRRPGLASPRYPS